MFALGDDQFNERLLVLRTMSGRIVHQLFEQYSQRLCTGGTGGMADGLLCLPDTVT